MTNCEFPPTKNDQLKAGNKRITSPAEALHNPPDTSQSFPHKTPEIKGGAFLSAEPTTSGAQSIEQTNPAKLVSYASPVFGTSEETLQLNYPNPKKRRLHVDVVRHLENSFIKDNKLEPDRKAQLSRYLGISPRQVAIWFQNRRVRLKSKQVERNFEFFKTENEALKLENSSLLVRIKSLQDKLASYEAKIKKDIIKIEAPENSSHLHQSSVPEFSCEQENSVLQEESSSQSSLSHKIPNSLSCGSQSSEVLDINNNSSFPSNHDFSNPTGLLNGLSPSSLAPSIRPFAGNFPIEMSNISLDNDSLNIEFEDSNEAQWWEWIDT